MQNIKYQIVLVNIFREINSIYMYPFCDHRFIYANKNRTRLNTSMSLAMVIHTLHLTSTCLLVLLLFYRSHEETKMSKTKPNRGTLGSVHSLPLALVLSLSVPCRFVFVSSSICTFFFSHFPVVSNIKQIARLWCDFCSITTFAYGFLLSVFRCMRMWRCGSFLPAEWRTGEHTHTHKTWTTKMFARSHWMWHRARTIADC